MARLFLICATAWLATAGTAEAGGLVTACASDVQTGAGLNFSGAMAFGGTITFACKPGSTIEITRLYTVGGRVIVDGGGQVTLKAASYRAMFLVSGDLTLRGLTLRNPYVALKTQTGHRGLAAGAGAVTLIDSKVTGSVNPFYVETITVRHSLFENNPSFALITAGSVFIDDSEFVNNGAFVLRSNRPLGSGPITLAFIRDSRFRDYGTAIEWAGRLTVRSSSFVHGRGGNRRGGAIRLRGAGVIDHTLFEDNMAAAGGAIWLEGGTLSLERATFRRNVAVGDGGAIGIGDTAEGSIISRYGTFTENRAARGGAIQLAWAGPQIALQGGPNTFAKNSAARGGAIYSELGRVQLQRSIFVGNTASSEGGAIFASRRGPALAAVLANSLLVRNSAPVGSAVSGSSVTLINTTVAQNGGPAIALQPVSHFAPPGSRPELRLGNALFSRNQGGGCGKAPAGWSLVQNGHNLQFPNSSCGPLPVADPRLSGLFEPGLGSPALTGGEGAVCAAPPISAKDVYGAVRPQGAACSIGAVEGDVDPRLFRKLIPRLAERIRQGVTALVARLD